LPIEGGSWVHFSPDGKWLMTTGGGGGCRLWAVDSWQQGSYLGGGGVFSPDSKLLELGDRPRCRAPCPARHGPGVRPAGGPPPGPHRRADVLYPGRYSAGDHQHDSRSVHVWDLRKIREQLAKLDLDWDPPSYPPPPTNNDEQPLQIQVELGDLNQEIARQAIDQQRRET